MGRRARVRGLPARVRRGARRGARLLPRAGEESDAESGEVSDGAADCGAVNGSSFSAPRGARGRRLPRATSRRARREASRRRATPQRPRNRRAARSGACGGGAARWRRASGGELRTLREPSGVAARFGEVARRRRRAARRGRARRTRTVSAGHGRSFTRARGRRRARRAAPYGAATRPPQPLPDLAPPRRTGPEAAGPRTRPRFRHTLFNRSG